MKQKYIPCELSVVEFKVERGFAGSVTEANPINDGFINATNTANIHFWSMDKQNGDFRNQQYEYHNNSSIDWFGQN